MICRRGFKVGDQLFVVNGEIFVENREIANRFERRQLLVGSLDDLPHLILHPWLVRQMVGIHIDALLCRLLEHPFAVQRDQC